MRPRNRWKKCLSIVTYSLTGIGLAIGMAQMMIANL
jgi:hypothetical protein